VTSLVRVGQRVRFVPYWLVGEFDDEKAKREKSVTGVVTIVNEKHRLFWCECAYKGVKQIETFHFADIGKVVSVFD
jgi:hypothetical protein